MSNRILIKRSNNVVDVFFGEQGFAPHHWARFVLNNKQLKHLKGASLPSNDWRFVCDQLGVNHGLSN